MKRVLLVSRYFAPENEIGAIRCTKLAKYLSRNHGWQVTVLAQEVDYEVIDPLLERDSLEIAEIIRIPKGRLERWMGEKTARRMARRKPTMETANAPLPSPNTHSRLLQWVLDELNFIQVWLKSREYAHHAWQKIKPRVKKFDAIISSYSPISEHLIAMRCKTCNPELVWVADYRDAPWNRTKKLWTERIQASVNSRAVLRRADYVTVISNGVAEDMGITNDSRTHLIYNGFDKEDLIGITPLRRQGLALAYLGGFYSDKRDLRPVFKALRQMIDDGQIDSEQVHVVYAGGQYEYIWSYASECGLEALLCDLGRLDRSGSLAVQRGAHILLLPSWNATGTNRGIMTGKFLEYMMIGRPILGIICGNLPNSLIKQHIDAGQLGFCYEQGGDPESFEALKRFLLIQYQSVMHTGKPEYCPETTYLEQFSYPNIAAKFADLIAERESNGR